MTEMITLCLTRPADLMRRMVLAGLSGLIVALAVELPQFDANKECQGGGFSSGIGTGLDVRHCDLVVRKTGSEIATSARSPILLPLSDGGLSER